MQQFLLFIKVFKLRFIENKLTMAAGHLTYNTMLAIVPLIMVMFSIFAAFPIFNEVTGELKAFIYNNFAPSIGDVVQTHLDNFVNNSRKMSAVGTMVLIAIALLLISNIDNTLNAMWHKTQKRRWLISFAIYWMILTLGPLLVGVSISVSTYILSLEILNPEGMLAVSTPFLSLVPFFITWLLFTLVYTIVPNTTVLFRHAAIGALLAAIFFTLGKQVFIWYITTFPSYQAIYGALAVLPIMIVWIHLSWLVVLIGAQVSAVFKDIMLINVGVLEIENNEELK
ncbi:virulence factor BrkB family protein [Pasteurella atlantica]|uniref:Virulence factor BrkB family protein n=2 Tax=Pasteurellaceae TaxID=712 RepID=A0ACC6HKA1_9PAST|nr:virulence factor BrkB family protein [Pasteurella atlantica]MDP8033106.1 virulence factor BrkB family protein [Pasteurella atlantica]MDP8035043.1 virulence factor BrkB family protein [Pasteurella atlantica]MDP8036997.1 virulence factor BrkB family protein [Pasteurella atlantica]MDP8047477.1 virulence factor BrkB family protein [Pasteurella atlantica]MDP8049146.1 virulence factor BrkB family protein [Pasteurella atlantica]